MSKDYQSIAEKGDLVATKNFLDKWEQQSPDDPELYSALFNYYIEKGFTENTYNKKDIDKALKYADEGIKRFPDRLDMRFGKTTLYLKIKNYDAFTEDILKILSESRKNDNQWQWEYNSKITNGCDVMIDALQGALMQVYESDDKNKLKHMLNIAERTYSDYPNNVLSIVNLAIVYILWGQYDDALEILDEAKTLEPNNFQVLGNIAQVYKLKGDKQSAIRYYQQIENVGDAKAIEYAKKQLESLTEK